MGALDPLLETLSADPGVRGRQFEHVCKWYLANDPVYRHNLRRIWLWNEWPSRWGADAGIDLVAEDHQGRLWAIQSKAYDPAYSITKANVDTFLSESARQEFDFRLLIATTNRVGRTAERTLRAQEKPAGCLLLSDLRAAEVSWPQSLADLRPARPRPKRPRPHQAQAIDDVLRGFETNARGQMIMACGTGKTLTALFIAQRLAAQRTLVLVPSLSLLKDTLREWTANAEPFDFLPVCSDDTVTDADAAVATTADLGFPVTTDPTEIAAFLRRRSGALVVFATYQSSPRIAAAFRMGRAPGFDLVISDEAHRCAGRVSSDFATVLDGDAIPAQRRLFMTATPRFFTGRFVQEAKEAEFEVASMDDESRFGAVFHRLGFSEAIERGLLSDYQVVIIGVDDATYLEWAQRGRFITTDGTTVTDARTLAGQIGLIKAMRAYDLHRTISFHSRVAGARTFARSMDLLVDWMPIEERPPGQLWCDYASGEMSAGDRSRLLDRLRYLDGPERGLLANARCLGEGIDVPSLDGVAFVDPRRSEVDIVQAVGRAIRLSTDKKLGTVVIPVFIETGGNPEEGLEASSFKPVWDVIKALRAHDDHLGSQLDELRRELGRRKSSVGTPSKIHFDLPDLVGADFRRAFDVYLVEHTSARWQFWFGLLQGYVEDNGHARVRRGYSEGTDALGQWLSNQRAAYGRGELAADRVAALESLRGWSWDPFGTQWEEAFTLLRLFVDREGHAIVPGRHTEDGYGLGAWVSLQRSGYRRKRITADRVIRLEALPKWSWDPFATQWEEGFGFLRLFVDREGHANMSTNHLEEGYRLGQWVGMQRSARSAGQLAPDRAARLEALPGWIWDTRVAHWEDAFRLLLQFVEREGHALVPASYLEDGYRLGGWVNVQRTRHGAGQISAARIARLEAVRGWSWDAVHDQWEEGFCSLLKFLEREGHALVAPSYVEEGYHLGGWVGRQRSIHSTGHLAEDRILRLEALHGWSWDPHADRWEEGFRLLSRFVEREGHAVVKRGHQEGSYRLGQWVQNQRSLGRRALLTDDRTLRLDALRGWTWDIHADRWEEGFHLLMRFAAREGHARVPPRHLEDGFRLRQWVAVQRTAHGKGRLDPSRVARLAELPEWTWDALADRWEEAFRLLSRYVEREGHARVPPRHLEDGFRLGQWVGVQRTTFGQDKLAADRIARLERLSEWSWDAIAARWDEGYRHLRRFFDREGHAEVPPRHVEDRYRLGQWVGIQRASRGKGVLVSARAARLEALSGWSWGPQNDQWEEGFRALSEFVVREGHARVPRGHQEGGFGLGQWIRAQRATFGQGKLAADRLARLERLPEWSWRLHSDRWEEGFACLILFVDRVGHANVPDERVENGFRLGQWVRVQRRANGKGELPGDRIKRLEALPRWSWSVFSDRWEAGYSSLCGFAARVGHTRVPDGYVEDGFTLGRWVLGQRRGRVTGRLSADRAARLEELPGWSWDALADKWDEAFGYLRRFVAREGHSLVPAVYREDAYPLGQWVTVQRTVYRDGRLSRDRITRLETLPRWSWSPLADQRRKRSES